MPKSAIYSILARLFQPCLGYISNAYSSIKTLTYTFYIIYVTWTIGIVNKHFTENVVYFEKGPAIILNN